MQNTRLNNLLETITRGLSQLFLNPWRRVSLILIIFLLGFFLGSAVSTTTGQKAELDIVVAAFLVVFTELFSKFFYGYSWLHRAVIWVETLNYLKVGFIYSLFLEALKLGS
ncbi:MAG: DUF565 domain-containing protein [Dolichospermum sp.]